MILWKTANGHLQRTADEVEMIGMTLFEKMHNAMRHSAEQGKIRRELDRQQNGGKRAELERGDVLAMLISAFLTILPVVGGLLLLMVAVAYFAFLH